MSSSSSSSNSMDGREKEKEPEILQQITSFFESLTSSFSSSSNENSSNNNSTLQKQLSSQSLLKSNQSGDSSSSLTGSTTTNLIINNVKKQSPRSPKSLSPTTSQNQFPAFYQYSQKALKELDEKRLLLIEHLKSVKFNLDSQSVGEDDPISVIKIRMELAKRKTQLENELRTMDDILNTKSFVDEPVDGFTSFLNMIIPDSSPSTSFGTAPTVDIHQPLGTLTNIPNSIIPSGTPLDNPDPNQPRFPPRENINAKLYVDCDDYFAASALAIENATREVFITAWFLSPEVYLIRYPTLDPKYRLDTLLLRKAKQGVKIFILLWDETKIATFKGSKRVKEYLEELHHNIKVLRHPPFTPIYWSHHQKTLIVDQEIAFVGGVDFAFGRYDNWCHHLIDVNSDLWYGKDYYNPCLGDMGDLFTPNGDSIDRKKIPRMPWHDVMVGVNGLAARDVALNFVLRWNHHRDDYFPPLYFNTTPLLSNGGATCQLLRSMDEWSGGGRNERSIHTAYIQAIEDADHYIYIENQNFVSTHAPGVWNQISFEIVKRIRRAIRKNEQFRVIIMLPSQQDGKFTEETHIRGLMHWQYLTLIKSENSIIKTLKKEFPTEDLSEYIGFYSLRTHACLEGAFVTEQIYVHSKLMIVDDRVVIVGSANINDRSLNGERDSELAFIVRDDKDTIKTRMNGKEYMASRTVYNFRLRLWKEHLGLLPHIDYPPLNPTSPPLYASSAPPPPSITPLKQSSSSTTFSTSLTANHNIQSPSTSVDTNNNNNNNNNNDTSNIPSSSTSSTTNSTTHLNPILNQQPISINSQYRVPKQSHHRSSSFQGTKTLSPLSSLPSSPMDSSPQHSPRQPNDQPTQSSLPSSLSSSSAPPPTSLTISSPPVQNIKDTITITKSISESVIIEDYDNETSITSPNNQNNNNNNVNNNINNNSINNNINQNNINNEHVECKNNNDENNNNNNNNNIEDNKVYVVSEIDSPTLKPTSISSVNYHGVEDSIVGGIDLTDPVDSSFYIGVWIATAASNTRIYDTVFASIPKNSIKTCDEYLQNLKKPVSTADARLLSEVRGNLIYHPLEFLADDNIQPTFLFTDDLFQ